MDLIEKITEHLSEAADKKKMPKNIKNKCKLNK